MNVASAAATVRCGPAYRRRRAEVAACAAGPGGRPAHIDYTEPENGVWQDVADALAPLWDRRAAVAVLEARTRLGLVRSRVPQLNEISERLEPISGFRFEAVAGLVDKAEFFAALADRRFLSTQYVRWEGSPLYTPEPDVIHEVVGHAHLLASAPLAELHRLAGTAMGRVGTPEARQFIADVFWFSGEFGILRENGEWKACGAGLLSSIGELGWFADNAQVRPLDIATMGTLAYDITRYQPTLFGAESIDQLLDVVGGFFVTCTDDSIAAMLSANGHHRTRTHRRDDL